MSVSLDGFLSGSPAADSVSAAASLGKVASSGVAAGLPFPTTVLVFSVRFPKNNCRSRRIEVFLSSTRSVT